MSSLKYPSNIARSMFSKLIDLWFKRSNDENSKHDQSDSNSLISQSLDKHSHINIESASPAEERKHQDETLEIITTSSVISSPQKHTNLQKIDNIQLSGFDQLEKELNSLPRMVVNRNGNDNFLVTQLRSTISRYNSGSVKESVEKITNLDELASSSYSCSNVGLGQQNSEHVSVAALVKVNEDEKNTPKNSPVRHRDMGLSSNSCTPTRKVLNICKDPVAPDGVPNEGGLNHSSTTPATQQQSRTIISNRSPFKDVTTASSKSSSRIATPYRNISKTKSQSSEDTPARSFKSTSGTSDSIPKKFNASLYEHLTNPTSKKKNTIKSPEVELTTKKAELSIETMPKENSGEIKDNSLVLIDPDSDQEIYKEKHSSTSLNICHNDQNSSETIYAPNPISPEAAVDSKESSQKRSIIKASTNRKLNFITKRSKKVHMTKRTIRIRPSSESESDIDVESESDIDVESEFVSSDVHPIKEDNESDKNVILKGPEMPDNVDNSQLKKYINDKIDSDKDSKKYPIISIKSLISLSPQTDSKSPLEFSDSAVANAHTKEIASASNLQVKHIVLETNVNNKCKELTASDYDNEEIEDNEEENDDSDHATGNFESQKHTSKKDVTKSGNQSANDESDQVERIHCRRKRLNKKRKDGYKRKQMRESLKRNNLIGPENQKLAPASIKEPVSIGQQLQPIDTSKGFVLSPKFKEIISQSNNKSYLVPHDNITVGKRIFDNESSNFNQPTTNDTSIDTSKQHPTKFTRIEISQIINEQSNSSYEASSVDENDADTLQFQSDEENKKPVTGPIQSTIINQLFVASESDNDDDDIFLSRSSTSQRKPIWPGCDSFDESQSNPDDGESTHKSPKNEILKTDNEFETVQQSNQPYNSRKRTLAEIMKEGFKRVESKRNVKRKRTFSTESEKIQP